MAIDWDVVGAAAMAALTGAVGWIGGRQKRKTAEAGQIAERDVIVLMREEVARLSARSAEQEIRIQRLEDRENRLVRHIFRLEALMRGAGLEPPPFDIAAPTNLP